MKWNMNRNDETRTLECKLTNSQVYISKFTEWTTNQRKKKKQQAYSDPNKSIVQIRLHNFNVCINLFTRVTTTLEQYDRQIYIYFLMHTRTHAHIQRTPYTQMQTTRKKKRERTAFNGDRTNWERPVMIHAFQHVLNVVVEYFYTYNLIGDRCSCATCLFLHNTSTQMNVAYAWADLSVYMSMWIRCSLRWHAHIQLYRTHRCWTNKPPTTRAISIDVYVSANDTAPSRLSEFYYKHSHSAAQRADFWFSIFRRVILCLYQFVVLFMRFKDIALSLNMQCQSLSRTRSHERPNASIWTTLCLCLFVW